MRRVNKEPQQAKNKKLISLMNYDLITGFTEDMAEMTQTNTSTVIENIILDRIISESNTSNYYIKKIYNDGLKDVFIALMETLSAGIKGLASHENAFPLVKLGFNIVNRPFSSGMDEKYKQCEEHFRKTCKYVKEKLEYETPKENLEFDDRMTLEDDILLLTQSENGGCDFVPYNYFRLVLARWETLGNYTYTFRMLKDVVSLSEERLWDSAEYRLQAIEIIKEVTEKWDIY